MNKIVVLQENFIEVYALSPELVRKLEEHKWKLIERARSPFSFSEAMRTEPFTPSLSYAE